MSCVAPEEPHRLVFLLPPTLALRAEPGRHSPCLHGCVLKVSQLAQVEIEGPDRTQVLDQAIRFLRVVAKDVIKGLAPPVTIGAVLRTPGRQRERYAGDQWPRTYGAAGRDGYTIVIGHDVAIAPGPIGPHVLAEASA